MRDLTSKITEKITDEQTRRMAAGLGLSLLVFGVAPTLAPRTFAKLFAFAEPDTETASMMRSVGVRDMAMGAGLLATAASGGPYAPWLLARVLADGGDTVSVGIAIAQGQRHPRFILLGGLALAAAVADATLWTLARRAK
ncbi:MAG TPA: DUF4267 domain-containing protein [Ktedonobacterales bacterium]